MKPETIKIDDVEYIRKDSTDQPAETFNDMPFVLIRTYSAGVHFGYLSKKESTLSGIEVTLIRARRVWYWDGACSLSQMAMDGVTKPNDCKFSVPVNEITLIAIEIIPITKKAQTILNGVPEWKK